MPEFATYLAENIFARQPAGKLWSTWVGRLMMPAYYMRILIYVTPTSIRYWPTRDFSVAPATVEVSHVG